MSQITSSHGWLRMNDYSTYKSTCSLENPEPNALSYATSMSYLELASKIFFPMGIIISEDIMIGIPIPSNITLFISDNPRHEFIKAHNKINLQKKHRPHIIDPTARIHPTACIGPEAMAYSKSKNDIISMKHMGNVIMEKNVNIGPYSVISRGTLDATIIRKNVKIGCQCNLSHNSIIGERTIITDNSSLAGSTRIGSDCWISMHSIIRRVEICDKVFIGLGSVVVKDITKPGMYYGNPAKYKKEWNGEWV